MDKFIEPIALSVFANYLYDYLRVAVPVTKGRLMEYFSMKQNIISERHAEKIIEVIEAKNLKAEAEQLNEEAFIENIKSDEQIKQLVEAINQTYIQNQTNIGSQTTFKDNSRQVIVNKGGYSENHYHTQAEKEKKS